MSVTATHSQLKQLSLSDSKHYRRFSSLYSSSSKSFPFEISDRKYLLYFTDIILIQIAVFIYCLSFASDLTLSSLFKGYLNWTVSITVIWSFYSYVFDLYSLERLNDFYNTSKYLIIAASLTVLSYIFIPWFTPPLPSTRLIILSFYFNTCTSLFVWRYFYSRLLNRPLFLKRVVIIGAGWSSKSLIDVFTDEDIFNYHLGYKVVGIIDNDEIESEGSYKGIKIIRSTHDLPKLLKRLKVDEIIFDDTTNREIESHSLIDLINCRKKGMVVTSLADFYENLTGRVLVHNTGREFYLAFPHNKYQFRKAFVFFSRAVDISFGVVGVAACVFFIPFIYVANLFWSKGPLFYSQERVGLFGSTFNIFKFRSMVVDAEKSTGAAWAQKNDARITAVGKFLRSSRIDELPQAWSVLKGEMSLIGPRPERPVFVEQLKKEIPFYDTRHLIKPGITGWAQAIYKYGSNKEDALMKVQYDLYYLKNRSIMMNVKVILKTISVIVRFKGI